MDYDPCICQFDSRLAIEVNLITQADGKLIGKTTGTMMSMKNGGTGTAAGSTGPDMDKGIPFIREVNSVLGAGGKSYDNINKFSSKIKELFPAKAASVDALAAASKTAGFLKSGLSALPWVGAAVSMLDYFMGGGKDAAGPQEVVMQPMTIEMSTTTKGTITTNSWYTSSSFNNPGNPRPEPVPEKMPYYNETMGVFSLLKRPVVQAKVSTVTYPDRSRHTTRTWRLAQDLQYVINPASGLEVQDFQAAFVVEGDRATTPIGDFSEDEGPVVNADSVISYAFRTPYVDAACLPGEVFLLESLFRTGDPSQEFVARKLTLKAILNLRPIGGSSTQQNVLFVARYPVAVTTVTSFAPLPLPLPACGVLPQATPATVAAVCNSTNYRDAITLLRPGKTAGTAPAAQPALAQLQVFPNPGVGAVRLRYELTQAGPVQFTVQDNLCCTVRTLRQPAQPAGPHETTLALDGLRAGIYFGRLQTLTQHQVERLVVTE